MSTTAEYELVFVRGIPFWNRGDQLLYYEPTYGGVAGPVSDPVLVGTYDKATGRSTVLSDEDLRCTLGTYLGAWRASLEPTERGKPVPPVAKPGRARRTATKSAKSSGSASSKE